MHEGDFAYGFDDLIHPHDASAFFQTFYEKKPLLIRHSKKGYISDIITTKKLETLAETVPFTDFSVQISKDGQVSPPKKKGNFVDFDSVIENFRGGSTVIFRGLHKYSTPLRELCLNAEKVLSHKCQTNIYLTPNTSQGFAPHFDTHDVIVIQCEGRKKWKLYGEGKYLPYPHEQEILERKKLPQPDMEFELAPGDRLYIPRGTIHEATTEGGASLHVTFGIIPTLWADLLASVCRQYVASNPLCRESLPPGFLNREDEISDQLRELVADLAKNAEVQSVVEAALDEVVSRKSGGRLSFSLNRGREVYDEDTKVYIRPDVQFRIKNGADRLQLYINGKTFEFPKYVSGCLELIIKGEPIRIRDLCDLDKESRQVLIRYLRESGLIDIAGV